LTDDIRSNDLHIYLLQRPVNAATSDWFRHSWISYATRYPQTQAKQGKTPFATLGRAP
jgi:hypothetical protein